MFCKNCGKEIAEGNTCSDCKKVQATENAQNFPGMAKKRKGSPIIWISISALAAFLAFIFLVSQLGHSMQTIAEKDSPTPAFTETPTISPSPSLSPTPTPRPTPSPVPTAVPASLNMGSFEGSTYYNSYFGIHFTIPDNWMPASESDLTRLYGIDSDYFDAPKSAAITEDLENEDHLYFAIASKYEFGAKNNAIFQFGCEKMPNASITLDQYVKMVKGALSATSDEYEFSAISEKTLGGLNFKLLPAKIQGISMDIYAAEKHGYFIFFFATYSSSADKKTLADILSSVQFENISY